jgi:hypothetical protein
MQVADIQGDATAATLGAQKTTAVGMVEDAAFLMMLATNLYSNQKLACIRETLCNAWDAHIEAGRTDVPVKVTITDEYELVIEDSGNGIPAEDFPMVYGTMGGSTKSKNVKVTGGFGLGAKSPWSYADSFRVINENQGTKTIYNLVRASVEAEGKPAIQQVMQVPTERSGLTVRIQLQQKDVEQMAEYIRAVVMHGDMNVLFSRPGVTETQLATMNLSTEVGSYSVADNWYFQYMGNHSLFVRYGAVIYPMLQTPGTQKAVDLLKQFMELVGFRKMVVQAAPGTLALTPNREALSSSKMTEDGITDLCVALVARIEDDLIKQIPGSIMTAVAKLSSGESFYTGLDQYVNSTEAIDPLPVRRYLGSHLGAATRAKYENLLAAAEHRGFKTKHTFTNKAATREYHRLRRRLVDKHWTAKEDLKHAFLKHYILRPLSRVFQKHPDLLKVSEFFHAKRFYFDRREKHEHLLSRVSADEFGNLKQLVDNPTVFVTSRLKNLDDSIQCCPSVVHGQASWVYRIAPKDVNKDAIIKAFEDAGFQVVDLTLNHSWDSVATELEIAKLNRAASRRAQAGQLDLAVGSKKKANLLMSLTNVYHDDTGERKMHQNQIKLMKSVTDTTDTPRFYVTVEEVTKNGKLGMFGTYLDLTDEERKLGVVVRTGVEKNMALKRGAVHVDSYLAKRLWDLVHTKQYADYCTKQRKAGLFDHHHVQETQLELLEYLDIKLPGFDKLTENAAFDRAASLVEGISATYFSSLVPDLTMEQLRHYADVVRRYKLDELPCVVKLKALKQDRIAQGLIQSCSNFTELAKQHPERKAALKSLVMGAFKNGN